MTSDYWDGIYRTKNRTDVSWYESEPRHSQSLIRQYAVSSMSVVDVGGGAPDLAVALLADGFDDVTVVDISPSAIEHFFGSPIKTVVADVREWLPGRHFDLWHDRAVGHFMTSPDDQSRYVGTLRRVLSPIGVAIIEGFAADGPESCSGLPVHRGFPTWVSEAIGDDFRMAAAGTYEHLTPWSSSQNFEWVVLVRQGADDTIRP